MSRFIRFASRLLPALIVLASIDAGAATTRTWPGAAPCNTTLQACLSASAAGDTVAVQSDGPIDEDLSIGVPLTFYAMPGYRPVLAPGRSISGLINPGAGVDWSLLIDGFTVPQGNVAMRSVSGNATVTFRHLDVTATGASFTGGNAIGIENFGSGHLIYDIEQNHVRANDTVGLHILEISSPNHGAWDGSIHDNRVESLSTAITDTGISMTGTGASAPNILIYSNQFSGNLDTGMWIWTGGQSNLAMVSNSFRTTSSEVTFGVELIMTTGASNTFAVSAFNNTIAGFSQGILLNGALSGRLSGNLFADDSTLAIHPQGSTATEDHSLFFASPPPAVLGAGSMVADPKFRRGLDDMRLGAGSPAIDAADSAALTTLLANAALPQIDADGLRRFKGAGSLADIGAFEFGDFSLIANATVGNGGVIDSALLNGASTALPQLTPDTTPDTYVASGLDNDVTGFAYASGHFGIIDESDGSAPVAGSAYDVFVPGAGAGAFQHVSQSATNVFGYATELTDPYVAGLPGRIVLATHRSPPLFDNPFGVVFGFGAWFIVEFNGTGPEFPDGITFAVYAQDPSVNAFVWNAAATASTAAIDHLLLNGEPCGRVYVTNGNVDLHAIGVKYVPPRWTIFNLDGSDIPAGSQFEVVVDEAATQFCRYDHLFHNGADG